MIAIATVDMSARGALALESARSIVYVERQPRPFASGAAHQKFLLGPVALFPLLGNRR
jgi:hypothetical protein